MKHKSRKRQLNDKQIIIPGSKAMKSDMSGNSVLALTKPTPIEDDVQIVEKRPGAGPSGQCSVWPVFGVASVRCGLIFVSTP